MRCWDCIQLQASESEVGRPPSHLNLKPEAMFNINLSVVSTITVGTVTLATNDDINDSSTSHTLKGRMGAAALIMMTLFERKL